MRRQGPLSQPCLDVLNVLRSGEPVSNMRLQSCSAKFSSQIGQLRRRGYDIRVVLREPGGLTWYRLLSVTVPL